MNKPSTPDLIERGRTIIRDEIEGMAKLADALDASVEEAMKLILMKSGRLIITGIGKSGLIGAKLAATFASTGTPSFFLHAAEAAHGDLGMIVAGDVVLALSNSGNSKELFPVIDYCAGNDIPLIGVCSDRDSRLGKAAAVCLVLPKAKEVCPNNLAPTTSATLTLVYGHVLAVLLMEARSFRDEQFAQFHPGGKLGLMLRTVRRHLENHPDEMPFTLPDASLQDVISVLSQGRKGCVVVTHETAGTLAGMITEGDLRRAYSSDMFSKTAADIMTPKPGTIGLNDSMRHALEIMKTARIANLVVVDDDTPVGVLHVKDLMQQGYL